MKKILPILFVLLVSLSAYSQDADSTAIPKVSDWRIAFNLGLNFNQASFSSNWKAGGVNSIALGSLLSFKADYKKEKFSWNNDLELQYGVVNNEGQGMRKNVDRIFLDSKAGYKISEKWDMYGSLNYLSQFANGFRYEEGPGGEEVEIRISKFMNPAFLTASLGFEYKPNDNFWLRLSPFSPRFTFVTDTTLYRSEPSNYGVEIGKTVRQEWLSGQLLASFDKNLADNLNLKWRYQLFANYETLALNTLDHRLDVILTASITKYINVNLAAIMLYDRDQDDKIQLSQALSLGLAYQARNFKE